MTNDSHHFRTAAQLESAGFYPVQGNLWKRGEELYLPLYRREDGAGVSITAPLASVLFNTKSTLNPSQSATRG